MNMFFEGYEIASHTAFAFAVDYGVRADLTKIDLKRAPKGKVRLVSKDGRAFSVLSVDGEAPNFPGGFDPAVHDPRTNYNVTYDYSDQPDGTRFNLLIETDHPDAPLLAIPLYSSGINSAREQWQTGPIRSLRRRTILGVIEPGATVDFEFTLHCRADDFDLGATAVNHELVWVDVLSKKPISAGKWKVKARLMMMDHEFRGLIDETIVLRGGANLQTSMNVIARVQDGADENVEQGDG
jgi:hypothetical protein